ncbi:MAG: 2,4-dihydroxyhept-2-ene-1,7-dioic acid aldolase [Proteobacteria bacterium]|nr:2,4-dihydroxyhept-2-ene-1,7-dioic acid aldolase [Bacteroidota bacterium]MBU1713411.1 2,4-dihydroxyhept-2-ene-1,7-dioic acid aldolase [Pseudomonadota bacterium]
MRTIREVLKAGKPCIGSWIQIPHSSIAEIMGRAGYDWVAVDLEHGSVSTDQLPDIFRALELGGTLPLVRLAQGLPKDCKQALDAGAGGVIVPMVESAEQLKEVRDECCWPPAGKRGVGFSRANLFGKYFKEYAAEAQAPLLAAMIEHIRAVENLEDILKVEGLDAVLIGPYDLSASMGITAQFDSPEFTSGMNRILTLCRHNGIPCGVHVVMPDPEVLKQRIEEGYRFIAYSVDAVFLNTSAQSPMV